MEVPVANYWSESQSILTSVAVLPCIRGMRIRVIDLLDLFAARLTSEQS